MTTDLSEFFCVYLMLTSAKSAVNNYHKNKGALLNAFEGESLDMPYGRTRESIGDTERPVFGLCF